MELSIRITELSDTFDAFIIVSSTWEPHYAPHPQVLYFDVWPWVPIVEGNGHMIAFPLASWLIRAAGYARGPGGLGDPD